MIEKSLVLSGLIFFLLPGPKLFTTPPPPPPSWVELVLLLFTSALFQNQYLQQFITQVQLKGNIDYTEPFLRRAKRSNLKQE